jgi:DNA repair exonuclease SbcCD ATPase subunit
MPEAQTETKIRSDVVLVTPQNYNQLLNKELGIPDDNDPEVVAAKELKEVEEKQAEVKAKEEAEKKAQEDPTHDAPELHEEKKRGINERFTKLTAAKREAEERATKAAEEAKALKEEREQLARERDELKAKYEPVKTEQDPEPLPEQFNDVKEYAKALKEWTADNTKREEAKRIAEETVAKKQQEKTNNWKSRWENAEKSIPDFKEVMAKADGLMISNEAQSALMDSEVGPEICHYLAKNPAEVEKMNGMTIDKMLKFIGKLEDKVEVKQETKQTVAKTPISQAPAPISPLKGGSALPGNKLDENGEFHGTYDEWKALRRSGKIK